MIGVTEAGHGVSHPVAKGFGLHGKMNCRRAEVPFAPGGNVEEIGRQGCLKTEKVARQDDRATPPWGHFS